MPGPDREKIQSVVGSFTDPYLHQDLAALHAVKSVAIESGRAVISVELGYPATGFHEELKRRLLEKLAAEAGVRDADIRITTNIISHAVQRGVPYVYGGAVGSVGMVFPVLPHHAGDVPWRSADGPDYSTPCFRCLFSEAPPPGTTATCDTTGVFGSLTTIVAGFQVTEALKILTRNYDKVNRKLLQVDIWSNDFCEFDVANTRESSDCPCCKGGRFDYLDGKAGSAASILCGRDAVQLRPRSASTAIDFEALATRLERHAAVTANEFLLRAQLNDGETPYEITLFPNGRAIIKGTQTPDVARGIYSKYIGI